MLWFLWPFILVFHRGASVRRAYAFVTIGAVFPILPLDGPLDILARETFEPRYLSSFSAFYVGPYATAYARGWLKGKSRVGADPITLEGFGMGGDYTPGAPAFSKEAKAKYHIEINTVALCGVTPFIEGHSHGFNTASVAEIKRRYGAEVVKAAYDAEANAQQQFAIRGLRLPESEQLTPDAGR